MNIEVKDIAGLSKPIEKLIDVASKGLGTVYKPYAIRKEADAEAYRIKAVANANAQAASIETIGQTNAQLQRVAILAQQNPEIVERARARLLTREVEAQLNVEAIVDAAAANLPESVSETPVADDWRRKFFIEAENVCDQGLQLFWGKLLAGEITSPGRFSLRTLDVLKHLSKTEAEQLVKMAKLCTTGGHVLKPDHTNTLERFGLTYIELISLRDAGLLHESDSLNIDLGKLSLPGLSFVVNGVNVHIYREDNITLAGVMPIYLLTKAGLELVQLVPPEPNEDYLKALGQHLRQQGMAVKRGVLIETTPGQSVMTFETDL